MSPNLGNVQFVSSGPLFTGPTGSPTFLEGTFQLFNVAGGRAELRVTSIRAAVPEPATWAMMIGGFGMVGGAMRSARRKQTVSVRYA